MGKKVDLYGYTLAEKLIAFESAINDLYSLLGDLGYYVTKEGFVDESTIYNTSLLTQPILENSFIGRPIYFVNSQITAYVNTYNPANGEFTVNGSHTIRGEQGIQGNPGINGINGTNGRGITSVTDIKDAQENGYTVSTLRIDYTEGDFDQVEIRAKNGADGNVPVDASLSATSINPVQNKVITAEMSSLQTDITNNMTEIADNKENINFLSEQLSTAQTDITALKGKKLYRHTLKVNGGALSLPSGVSGALSFFATCTVINNSKEPITLMAADQVWYGAGGGGATVYPYSLPQIIAFNPTSTNYSVTFLLFWFGSGINTTSIFTLKMSTHAIEDTVEELI